MIYFFHSLWLIITVVLVAISSVLIGRIVWTKITHEEQEPSLPVAFFLGEVIYSIISIFVSLIFSYPVNLLILLFFLAVPFFLVKRPLEGFKIFNPIRINGNLQTKILWIILLLFLGVNFFHSFLRPFDWDVVAYHDPVVKEITRGRINFPLLSESPYIDFYTAFSKFFGSLSYSSEAFASIVYGLSGKHPGSVHVVYFLNFLFFLTFVNSFLKKEYKVDSLTVLITLILLATNYGIVILLSTGYIDINVMIYQFLGLIIALESFESKKYNLLLSSMFFVGYSVGQKYTSVYFLPFYFGLIFFELLKKRRINQHFGLIIKGISLMIVSGGFWYLKNLILHRNPVYPLFFGHRGVSDEEYRLMIDLLFKSGVSRTLTNLWETLKMNYANETSTLIVTGVIIFFLLLRRFKFTPTNLYLLLLPVYLYGVNFYFASQVSRHILIVPISLHILFSQFIDKYKKIGIVILIIVIASTRLNNLQWSVWNAKLYNIWLMVKGDYHMIETQNIGCVADVMAYIKEEDSPRGTKTLNLWDPYASTFYEEEGIFYRFGGKINHDHFQLTPEMRYVYVNENLKKDFLENADAHRDIDPLRRAVFEEKLLSGKKIVYEKGVCLLYSLQ